MVEQLRKRGIKIANTTGFDSWMMVDLIRLAAESGYQPGLWVCPDQVGKGRPAPWTIHFAAKELDLYPLSHFVKVGDTTVDVAEAHNAGVWTVSVVASSNKVGFSAEQWAVLSENDRREALHSARAKLAAWGPPDIIDTVADLMPVIDDITARITRGERP